MEFNYKVKITEKYADSITVEFFGDGLSTVTIGTPYPPVGIEASKFFEQYAPIHKWIDERTPKQDLEVGFVIENYINLTPPEQETNPPVNQETVTLVLETQTL